MSLEMDLENNDLMEIFKKLNPTHISQKRSQYMAYAIYIMILTVFAKKNRV
jgi:hypothetical protein